MKSSPMWKILHKASSQQIAMTKLIPVTKAPLLSVIMFGLLMLVSSVAVADWTDARCDIYPKGEDHSGVSIPCVFSQRQGYINIERSDGVSHDLAPYGDTPGNYKDQYGNMAYRNSGLGDRGLIFRMKDESVFVYWDTSGLPGTEGVDNYAAPYSTAKWDATTRLNCVLGAVVDGDCAVGINRGPGNRQAVIAIMRPDGVERVLQFDGDQVVSPGEGEIQAELLGDEWIIKIDDDESYRIPLAAVEGG